ncbi:GNAT family N-acetyltransferase [Bacillus mycoides]|uniref:GNAT family N-acetyltransferase n=1 Tax=Bacillus mycoides TaxID=1405 RepID=UPI00159BA621|nr:GNAT family N-acetyltransferase [Bacillus mycoides]MCQ6530780.1 GNAT family N-acetyltransferase [Bacillus mycoides]
MECSKLEGNGLLIRKILEEDIELIREWRNQTDVRKYFINNNYINKDQQKKWFEEYLKKKSDIMFIIEETIEFKSAIGTVALYNINLEKNSAEFGRLMIGYLPSVGKGFGKRAAILACKYAFEILGLSEIYLNVLIHNVKAINLYSNLGFVVRAAHPNEFNMVLSKEDYMNYLP